MRSLTKLGLFLTAVWLSLFIVLVFLNYDDTTKMSLNELGDFLAGASAPMALLWLVIGYFQHGEELRLNTQALKAQQEELRQQVAETAILAENSERQAQAAEKLAQLSRTDQEQEALREAREAEPELVSHGGSSSGDKLTFKLLNRGGEARNIKLFYEGPHLVNCSPTDILDRGATFTILLRQDKHHAIEYPIDIRVDCEDRLAIEHAIEFEIAENNKIRMVSHSRQPRLGP